MRILGAVAGIIGGLVGFAIASLNSFTEALFIASSGESLPYLLMQLVLGALCLLAVVGSATVVWRPRVGAALLVAATVGVAILGGVHIAPYLAPEFRPYFSPFVFPVISAPLLVAAAVFAALAARRSV